MNGGFDKAGRWAAGFVVVSFVLAVLLVVGESQNGLFRVLAPAGLRPAEEESWLTTAYQSWWASLPSHPFGFIAYLCIAVFGIYVIILQNVVGVFCAYLIVALRGVAQLDVDWMDRDGSFGWHPVARVFRTVKWSLALHGTAISTMIVVLGIPNFPWILALVASWVAVLPLYALFPTLVFRAVEREARSRKITELNRQWTASFGGTADVEQTRAFREEFAYVNAVRVRPLRSKRSELPALFVLVLLPVVLTAAQILFSVRFGGQ